MVLPVGGPALGADLTGRQVRAPVVGGTSPIARCPLDPRFRASWPVVDGEPDEQQMSQRILSGDAGSTTIDYDPLEGLGHQKKSRLSPGVRNGIEWAVVIIGAIVITVLLRTFAFQTFYIPSES